MLLETLTTLLSRLRERGMLKAEDNAVHNIPSQSFNAPEPPSHPPGPNAVIEPGPNSISNSPHSNDQDSSQPHLICSNTPDNNASSTEEHPVIQGFGFFQHAHHLQFNNTTMVSQTFAPVDIVLQLLSQKRTPGAGVDSSAREPPPKCHPDTRKSLRARIAKWATAPDRHWRMFWVLGPAGVGKSAVAQTIAEEFKESGRLGAAFFFSREGRRDNPDGVIPTLVYQLAVQHRPYKRIIAQRFADDPTILEKSRRAQFKELIIEPFYILMSQQPTLVTQPLLIVLDGLDECNGEKAQCEFIELISDHVRLVDTFPLLWLICSRPEWHFKCLLSEPDYQVTCWREELLINNTEAQHDVVKVISHDFREIRRRYRDRLDESWPPESDLRQIAGTASGLFAFASTVIRFVGDTNVGDPQAQLRVCINFLGGLGKPGATDPLHALHLLYRRILSKIPATILPNTMRILGMLILYSPPRLSIQNQANFLHLSRASFYRALQPLHSLLHVPPASDANTSAVEFYHASFGDYLRDPRRSSPFSVDQTALHHDIALRSLQWQRSPVREIVWPYLDPIQISSKWFQPQQDYLSILQNFALTHGWTTFNRLPKEDAQDLVTELEDFDFNSLNEAPAGFSDFLRWFSQLENGKNPLFHVMTPKPTTEPRKLRILTNPLCVRRITKDPTRYLWELGWPLSHPEGSDEFTLHLQIGRAGGIRDVVHIVSTRDSPWSSIRPSDLMAPVGYE